MSHPTAPEAIVAKMRDSLQRGIGLCERADRPDLAGTLHAAEQRLASPGAVVGIVGEFKQGKSSLINGLLGEDVCPVDDDIATAVVTLISHGTNRQAFTTFRGPEGDQTERVDVDAIHAFASERADDDARARALLVDIRLPSPFLAHGITLIDTPGVGGLNPGYTATTMAHLRLCDALLFVTDASAPLARHELQFLHHATATCPAVLVVVSKTDLYPEWRRVIETNAGLIARAGLQVPVSPLSSALRRAAFEANRADLNDESGFPSLLIWLDQQVVSQAEALAVAQGRVDLFRCLNQLREGAAAELRGLEDSEAARTGIERLKAARDHLERLRAGGARWLTVLNDGFGDLAGNVDHSFRADLRNALRTAEDTIEQTDPSANWDELTADVREQVARAADAAVISLESGARRIAEEIAALLSDEEVGFAPEMPGAQLKDVDLLWPGKDLQASSLGTYAGTGYAGLRGAQGGILVFGMLASLAGLAVSTMALAGLGLVFGGKQLLDERKRHVAGRRQQARQLIRQFIDDAQFSVAKDMRDLTRHYQRQLRDHFSGRLAELIETNSHALEALRQNLDRAEAGRGERVQWLHQLLTEVKELQALDV